MDVLPAYIFVFHMPAVPKENRRGWISPLEPEFQKATGHYVSD